METTSIRINKYLANVGLCARRDVELLLKKKIVTVNGKQINKPGVRINPAVDEIRINGNRIKPPTLVYYLVNKPKGIISTTDDEQHRKNVTNLIPTKERIYPVGRLDRETSGLLILTNDGALTNLLTHPRYHVPKTYLLTITGKIQSKQLYKLQHGVKLQDGMTAPAEVKILKDHARISEIEMTLHEGRNRQIRRMCEAVHINLTALQRIAIGPIQIGSLKEGQHRQLTDKEIQELKQITGN